MRLELETNGVASALLWEGPPKALLRMGLTEGVELFTSIPMLAELTEILPRPKVPSSIRRLLLRS